MGFESKLAFWSSIWARQTLLFLCFLACLFSYKTKTSCYTFGAFIVWYVYKENSAFVLSSRKMVERLQSFFVQQRLRHMLSSLFIFSVNHHHLVIEPSGMFWLVISNLAQALSIGQANSSDGWCCDGKLRGFPTIFPCLDGTFFNYPSLSMSWLIYRIDWPKKNKVRETSSFFWGPFCTLFKLETDILKLFTFVMW